MQGFIFIYLACIPNDCRSSVGSSNRSGPYSLYNTLHICEQYFLTNNYISLMAWILEKPVSTKTNEFLENFRTAFDPPPPLFRKKILQFFSQTGPNRTKFATKFFRSEMTPPLFDVFPENHDQNWRF